MSEYNTPPPSMKNQYSCAEIYAKGQHCEGLPLSDFLTLGKTLAIVDVRSPGEFTAGHVPGAHNLPLFTDEERAEVGKCYKHAGRDAALVKGLEFAEPKKEKFIQLVTQIFSSQGQEKNLAIYCWRGGERSAAMACLLRAHGFLVYRLCGGYKTFRNFVLQTFDDNYTLQVLGGKSGSGKTAVLQSMRNRGAQVLDLEYLARHKGSAFGAMPGNTQPSCEHFENRLALGIWSYDRKQPIWVEDESQKLGKVRLPKSFFEKMQSCKAVLLDAPYELRLARVLDEYATLPVNSIKEGLERIQQRLGGQAFKDALHYLEKGDLPALAQLLLEYYDRGYTHQARQRIYSRELLMTTPEECALQLAGYIL